jgi:hypothetical protein
VADYALKKKGKEIQQAGGSRLAVLAASSSQLAQAVQRINIEQENVK